MKKIATLLILCFIFAGIAPSVQAMTSAESQALAEQAPDDQDQTEIYGLFFIPLVLQSSAEQAAQNMQDGQATDLDKQIMSLLGTTFPALFNTMKQGYQNAPAQLTEESQKLVRFLYRKQKEYDAQQFGLPQGGVSFPRGVDFQYAQLLGQYLALQYATQVPTQYDAQGKLIAGLSLPMYEVKLLESDLGQKIADLFDTDEMKQRIQKMDEQLQQELEAFRQDFLQLSTEEQQ